MAPTVAICFNVTELWQMATLLLANNQFLQAECRILMLRQCMAGNNKYTYWLKRWQTYSTLINTGFHLPYLPMQGRALR